MSRCFAFQFAAVLVQEMLFAGEEGGEEIENSVNQVLFYKLVICNTVIRCCWEIGILKSFGSPLLPATIASSSAIVVGTVSM